MPVVLALALAAALPLNASETVRRFSQEIAVGNADKVVLDFPVGEVQVTAWDQRQVKVDLGLECRKETARCVAAAKSVRLVYRVSGDSLRIEVKDWPKLTGGKGLQVVAHVSVPRDLPLAANLGVGELRISGLEADLDGDLGVGELRVDLPQAAFGQAHLDTGIGEATLLAGGRRVSHGGLIARSVDWNDGPGRSRVNLDCGVGEIDLTLR
jgi:hypothetical protein